MAMSTFQLLAVVAALAGLAAATSCAITSQDALLLIDVQNDFMEESPVRSGTTPLYTIPPPLRTPDSKHIIGGSLAVSQSGQIIDTINTWVVEFNNHRSPVIYSVDWHEENHCSFCRMKTLPANAKGGFCGPLGPANSSMMTSPTCADGVSRADFDMGRLMQWPDHCVARTLGARFHPYLHVGADALVVKKGISRTLDAYSAVEGYLSQEPFPFDSMEAPAALATRPRLPAVLAERGVRRVFVAGLATDYCVLNTVLDLLGKNPARGEAQTPYVDQVVVLGAAVRGVAPDTTAKAIEAMQAAGAIFVSEASPALALADLCAHNEL